VGLVVVVVVVVVVAVFLVVVGVVVVVVILVVVVVVVVVVKIKVVIFVAVVGVVPHTQYEHTQDWAEEESGQARTTSPTRRIRWRIMLREMAANCEHNLGLSSFYGIPCPIHKQLSTAKTGAFSNITSHSKQNCYCSNMKWTLIDLPRLKQQKL
jgi:hypothetical protein